MAAVGLGVVAMYSTATPAVAVPTRRTRTDANPIDDDLARLFADPGAAEAIGRAYLLDQIAPCPTLRSLRAQVRLALQLEEPDQGRPDRTTLRARLRARIRQDFADGNVTMIDGWMLSRIEAQTCAIAYLSAADAA